MLFETELHTHAADKGRIKGRQEDIACGCWFTSTGNTLPKYIKYRDEEGVIHGISHVEVLYSEKQNFCGIPAMVYVCRAEEDGREYHFKLLFHLEECKWKIIWE